MKVKPEGVVFTITSGETVLSHYLTDGLAEPYCIEGLPTGDYVVSRSLAANEATSDGAEQMVTVTDGAQIALDWGSYRVEPAPATGEEVARVVESDAAATPASCRETTEARKWANKLVALLLIRTRGRGVPAHGCYHRHYARKTDKLSYRAKISSTQT